MMLKGPKQMYLQFCWKSKSWSMHHANQVLYFPLWPVVTGSLFFAVRQSKFELLKEHGWNNFVIKCCGLCSKYSTAFTWSCCGRLLYLWRKIRLWAQLNLLKCQKACRFWLGSLSTGLIAYLQIAASAQQEELCLEKSWCKAGKSFPVWQCWAAALLNATSPSPEISAYSWEPGLCFCSASLGLCFSLLDVVGRWFIFAQLHVCVCLSTLSLPLYSVNDRHPWAWFLQTVSDFSLLWDMHH